VRFKARVYATAALFSIVLGVVVSASAASLVGTSCDALTEKGHTKMDTDETGIVGCFLTAPNSPTAIWKSQTNSTNSGWVKIPAGAQHDGGTVIWPNDPTKADPERICKDAGYNTYSGSCKSYRPGYISVLYGHVDAVEYDPSYYGSIDFRLTCQPDTLEHTWIDENTEIQCLK
jgi:hypothetical protein